MTNKQKCFDMSSSSGEEPQKMKVLRLAVARASIVNRVNPFRSRADVELHPR